MTNPTHDSSTPDAITVLERAYDDLVAVVASLTTEQLSLPTNCPGWDARALLNHTLGTAVMFTKVNAGEFVGEDAGDVVGDDPLGAVERVAAANLDAWRMPGALDGMRVYPWGAYPAPISLVINVSEVALHAWDVAVATDQVAALDSGAAQLVFDLYSQIPLDDMRAHGVFGAEVSVPSTAPVQERVLGLLGRVA